jgi:hypothetical protein
MKERMLGTWRLLRWTRVADGVEEPSPFGTDPVGLLLYLPDGYMSANLMRRNGANYLGYSGRYEIDEVESSVLHRIEVSSSPKWTNTARKRFVQFTDGRMALSTLPLPAQGKEAVVTLLWERV